MDQPSFQLPIRISKGILEFDPNFVSEERVLDDWLYKKAVKNEIARASRTYVSLTSDGLIAGFYCLVNCSLACSSLRGALSQNLPSAVPAVLLRRMAVRKEFCGKGLGRSLVKHALEKTAFIADESGAIGLVTEPISITAKNFYLHVGFEEVREGSRLLICRLPRFCC